MSKWYCRVIEETDSGQEAVVDHELKDGRIKVHWSYIFKNPRALEVWLVLATENLAGFKEYDTVLLWTKPNRNGK